MVISHLFPVAGAKGYKINVSLLSLRTGSHHAYVIMIMSADNTLTLKMN